jgi:hypothetical protein
MILYLLELKILLPKEIIYLLLFVIQKEKEEEKEQV